MAERIPSLIDSLIRNIPPTLPSYIRDTYRFLREISRIKIPKDAILVTLDVSALYTNFPHNDGIEPQVNMYDAHRAPDSSDGHVVATLSRFVLELNGFEFDEDFCIETSGTAIGTKMAPNYANIFIRKLEDNFVSTCSLQPIFYRRYIDDIC